MDETHCQLVSVYALMKSASHRSPMPSSDFGGLSPNWYLNLFPGCILHVCSQALPEFMKKVLPNINVPFKLLTNNSDSTIPNDYDCQVILDNPFLLKWYAQNCVGTHDKFVKIPIGLNYHSMVPSERKKHLWSKPEQHRWGWGTTKYATEQEADIVNLKNSSKPFWQRQIKGYGNYQFVNKTRYGLVDRHDALQSVSRDLVFYEPIKVTRDVCWKNMIQHAFVISPHGNGLDCHRTWEALCLGCIPIVKTSGLDSLFDDLPVWIVSNWSDVTQENMVKKIEEFKTKTFKYEKLTMAYWRNILNE